MLPPDETSWCPEDWIRHFLYESVGKALSGLTWEGRQYNVLDFASPWYGDPAGGWQSHMRWMLKKILGNERINHILGEYPQYNIEDLNVLPDSIDILIADQVLEHVQRPWLAANEIHKVLKSGGIAIVATPGLYPIHPSPLDCFRIMPDGYRVLFPEAQWEWLAFDMWGSAERVGYEYTYNEAFPNGPPHRTVAESIGTTGYVAGNDGRCPIQIWLVGRKK